MQLSLFPECAYWSLLSTDRWSSPWLPSCEKSLNVIVRDSINYYNWVANGLNCNTSEGWRASSSSGSLWVLSRRFGVEERRGLDLFMNSPGTTGKWKGTYLSPNETYPWDARTGEPSGENGALEFGSICHRHERWDNPFFSWVVIAPKPWK